MHLILTSQSYSIDNAIISYKKQMLGLHISQRKEIDSQVLDNLVPGFLIRLGIRERMSWDHLIS
jgi:hypothetical protein